jgi:NodT family efflux transporter outer membrane factor (OMF) lipoprotein
MLVLSAALCGCALGPRHDVYRDALDGSRLGLSSLPAPPVADRWWEAFGDPQLNALVARAIRNSPTLAQALARMQQASALALVSAGARTPTATLSLSAVRERLSERYIIPPPYGGSSYWDSQLNLGLNWELDFWGRQRALLQAADSRVRAAALDARGAQLALESAMVASYLEFDRLQALLETAEQLLANRQRLAALTQRRVTAGVDNQLELAIAATLVPAALLEIRQLQANSDLLRHQLAQLCGQGAEAYAGITRPQLQLAGALPLPQELPGDLLLLRPDIQAALARVYAADANAAAARLARYPDISLSAFAGTASLSLDDLLAAPARTFGAGTRLLLPMFDGGQLRSRHLAARSELDDAIALYHGAVLRAVREVADQLSLVRAYTAERGDAQRQFELTHNAWQLADKRMQAGISAAQPVLELQSRANAARINQLSQSMTVASPLPDSERCGSRARSCCSPRSCGAGIGG